MDFVVAGLGIGALIVVIGFAIRDLGPLMFRPSGLMSPVRLAGAKRRWRGLCHDVSSALAIGGGVIVVATIAAVTLGVSDRVGAFVVGAGCVAGAAAATVLGVIAANRYRSAVDVEHDSAFGGILSIQTETEPVEDVVSPPLNRLPRRRKPEVAVAALPFEPEADFPQTVEDVTSGFSEDVDSSLLLVAADDDESDVPTDSTERATQTATHVLPDLADLPSWRPLLPTSAAPELPAAPAPIPVPEPLPVAPMTSGGIFKSSLLADIGLEPQPAPAAGFSSRLLEDVTPDEVPDSAHYHSALLAEVEAREVDIPEAPVTANAVAADPAPANEIAEDVHFEDIVTAEVPAPTNRSTPA